MAIAAYNHSKRRSKWLQSWQGGVFTDAQIEQMWNIPISNRKNRESDHVEDQAVSF